MSIFTLAISCLTISNLPWFMVLTLQVPICNIVFCSIGLYFHHKSHPQLSAIFLWLHLFILSGVIYLLIFSSILGTYQSGVGVISFCLFILFMGFTRQEYWSGLLFPSPVDHILSELSNMTHPSQVALHGMAHSFIELDTAVVHVTRLVSFLWL